MPSKVVLVKRETATLADGRSIHYYAAGGRDPQPAPDTRALDSFEPSGEVRYDALNNTWVAIAAHRQTRTHLPATHECPLCPSTPENLSEIPATGYEVVVFDNRFPSLSQTDKPWSLSTDGVDGAAPAVGKCEVVCFSQDHTASFADLDEEQARLVFDVWADRTAALMDLHSTAIVFPFENRGKDIGVTLHHPHGQIYAYPFVPPTAERMLRQAQNFRARTGKDLFAELISREVRDASRILLNGEHWIAYVPYAARWPYEIHLVPHRDVKDFSDLTDDERAEGSRAYLELLRAFDRIFGLPMPYVASWQQAPKGALRDVARLHLQLASPRRAVDKLKMLAGSEQGMGAFINDIAPEAAAAAIRAQLSQ